jgi:magnesium chelatase subunit I
MPLDMQFVFTANLKIIQTVVVLYTIKNRIGSQITHYPETIAVSRTITEQEAKLEASQTTRFMFHH